MKKLTLFLIISFLCTYVFSQKEMQPRDIFKTDKAMIYEFSENKHLAKWLKLAKERVALQGLPARSPL